MTMRRIGTILVASTVLVLSILPAESVLAQRSRRSRSRRGDPAAAGDFAAERLLKRAQALLTLRETERGMKMLQTVVEQYPESPVRYRAYLAMGRHYLDVNRQSDAVRYFSILQELKQPNKEMSAETQELYLEAQFLTGLAYYNTRQYENAFSSLRKITRDYPNTLWANQAFYYIGMCHYAKSNWNKAIEALTLVGTFIDPDSPSVEYVEAGRRFYVKLFDDDLPVLRQLGHPVTAEVTTAKGDKETITCIPLSQKGNVYIGSLPTQVAEAVPGDHVLQVLGGDTIETVYSDGNTREGERNVRRSATTRVVSTATLRFTLGTYESDAAAAFLGQPLFVFARDVDMDTSAQAEGVNVKIVSRYKEEQDEDDAYTSRGAVDLTRMMGVDEERYRTRDELVLSLTELGEAPIRTGRFGGSVQVERISPDESGDKADGVISCALGDEVVATYVDSVHMHGESAREVTQTISVVGEIDGRPRATQNVVLDELVRAKKNLVEASAYLELARIFRGMGLLDGAREKCEQGLELVESIILTTYPIPENLKTQAFKRKWEMQIAVEDYDDAIATCKVFNQLYPNSPLVDEALMSVGTSFFEQERYREAISVFRQILSLNNSLVKAEAHFHIAEATEKTPKARPDAAIPIYKEIADRYPDSPHAGTALAKLVDYYTTQEDHAQANDLLEQIFQDYPDASFLDSMLIKWTVIAYAMGEYDKALEKCSALIFEYPDSPFAAKARAIKPRIEAKVNRETSRE